MPIADVEYGRADHARKYRSTAGSQPPIGDELRNRCLRDLDRDGYAIIEDVFDRGTVERIRREVEPLFVHEGGRNAFEGYQTRRLNSPLDDTRALDPVAEHPLALELLDEIFEPNYLLSQLQVIDIAPGEAAHALHADDPFYPGRGPGRRWARPRSWRSTTSRPTTERRW